MKEKETEFEQNKKAFEELCKMNEQTRKRNMAALFLSGVALGMVLSRLLMVIAELIK